LGIGSIYALVALGFVLIYKCTGILNLAQGNLVLLGAYLGYCFAGQLGLPWWMAILIILLVVAVFAVVLERLALRPLLGKPILAQILMTLGLASLLQGFILIIWGGNLQKLPAIFPTTGALTVLNAQLSYENAAGIVLAILLLLIFAAFFKYTQIGLRMRAVADDAVAAQAVGVQLSRIYQVSWAVSGIVAALGGILLGSIGGVHGGLADLGLKSIVVVLLGGLESVYGVMIAGAILGLIEVFAIQYVDPLIGGGIQDIVAFAILIPVLLLLPYGLFGWKRIERV